MKTKAIAIIPARGGSQRIPRKNIKEFCGKPLLAYSIEVALRSGLFSEVVVSTDDTEIAEVAKRYGASVPFMRPRDLSDHFTGTGAVVAHACTWLKDHHREFDYVCTIYATAPLLQERYLKEGLRQVQNSSAKYSFSAASMPFPIQRTFKLTKEGRCEMFWPENFTQRSQDLEPAYQDAGQFYFNDLSKNSDALLFGKDSIPVILPRYLVQDIDDEEDWLQAELLYRALQLQHKQICLV